MTEEKKLKIEFAPGCFDDFEGTQEELDEMIRAITDIFENNSREELEAMSTPVDFDDLDEDFDDVFDEIKTTINDERKLH